MMNKICILCKRSKHSSNFPIDNCICFQCQTLRESIPQEIKIQHVIEDMCVREGEIEKLGDRTSGYLNTPDFSIRELGDGGYLKERIRMEGEIW